MRSLTFSRCYGCNVFDPPTSLNVNCSSFTSSLHVETPQLPARFRRWAVGTGSPKHPHTELRIKVLHGETHGTRRTHHGKVRNDDPSTHACFVQRTPHRTHACAHFFVARHFSSNAHAFGSRCLSVSVWSSLKSSDPRTMSLLGVIEFLCFPSCLDFVYDTADWNETYPVCDSALVWDRLAIWPIRLQTLVYEPKILHRKAATT